MTGDGRGGWALVAGDTGLAIAERGALGTSARVAVWPPSALDTALRAVDGQLDEVDRAASRFRPDSELSRVNAAAQDAFVLSETLSQALAVALWAARWSGGRVDPTVGGALVALGYDRDFSAVGTARVSLPAPIARPAAGWRGVRLEDRSLHRPRGLSLDLGATGKGFAADRAAAAALDAQRGRGGLLVSLGGDIAVRGRPPAGGWPVRISEDPDGAAGASVTVRLAAGGLATSSVLVRRWRRGGKELHHLLDPATGEPAAGPWRTATVAGPTCAAANAASTAAIVAGADAEPWLQDAGLPARLVGRDGSVRLVGRWPEDGTPLTGAVDGHGAAPGGGSVP